MQHPTPHIDRARGVRPSVGDLSTGVTALVPLRTGGKSRLAQVLPPVERARLSLAMFDDVLDALSGAGVTDVHVLAADPAAASIARDRGLPALHDPQEASGLRHAVDAGLRTVGADVTRLVVAADLPRVHAEDITAALTQSPSAAVLIARMRDGGTGLLRLRPTVDLPSQFGPDSAARHARVARSAGLSVAWLERVGLTQDLDDASDLAAAQQRLEDEPATLAARTRACLLDPALTPR